MKLTERHAEVLKVKVNIEYSNSAAAHSTHKKIFRVRGKCGTAQAVATVEITVHFFILLIGRVESCAYGKKVCVFKLPGIGRLNVNNANGVIAPMGNGNVVIVLGCGD